MKIKNLFYVSLAALSLAACSKDDAPAPQAGVTFNLSSLPSSLSKAYSTSSVGAESDINSATIYIFPASDASPIVVTPMIATGSKSASYIQNLTPGDYTAAAVVNFDVTSPASVADVADVAVDFTDNTEANFVMYASHASFTVDANTPSTVNFEVKRVLSAIQLGKITISLPENVDPSYTAAVTAGNVWVKSMSIKESNPQVKLDGTAITTGTKVGSNNLLSASFGDEKKLTAGENSIQVTPVDGSSTVEQRAYVAPGTGFVMYLALQFGADNVRNYMIELPNQSLVANNLYTMNLTINGTGSTTPGVRDGSATGSLTVANWTTGDDVDGGSVSN